MRLKPSAQSHYAPDNLDRPHSWGEDAACRGSKDPDLWFADGDDAMARADRRTAKEICGRCTARHECLTGALERDERAGVWGGLTYDERRGLIAYRPAGRKTLPTQEAGSGAPPGEHAATA